MSAGPSSWLGSVQVAADSRGNAKARHFRTESPLGVIESHALSVWQEEPEARRDAMAPGHGSWQGPG